MVTQSAGACSPVEPITIRDGYTLGEIMQLVDQASTALFLGLYDDAALLTGAQFLGAVYRRCRRNWAQTPESSEARDRIAILGRRARDLQARYEAEYAAAYGCRDCGHADCDGRACPADPTGPYWTGNDH